MATTSSRARAATLATAITAAGLLAAGAAWLSTGAGTKPEAKPFWSLLTGQASEVDLPRDVTEIARRADAIVVARVTGVVEGREFKGLGNDPTPGDPSIPPSMTVFVQLTVDKVVSGSVAEQQVLKLEMFAPPKPLSIDTVRSDLPPGQLLFFLWNKADGAKRDGFTSPAIQLRERDIWGDLGSRSVIAQGPTGLYQALHPHEGDATFLRSFEASTVEEAAERAAQARG